MSGSSPHNENWDANSSWELALDAVRDLTLAVAEYRHAAAAHFGVGVTETIAISYLRRGPLTGRDLAVAMGLAPSTVTSVIDRLEAAGFAQRSSVPGDRRQMLVALTAAGEQVLAWSRERLLEVLSALGEERLPEAVTIMNAFSSALRRENQLIQREDV